MTTVERKALLLRAALYAEEQQKQWAEDLRKRIPPFLADGYVQIGRDAKALREWAETLKPGQGGAT